MKKLIRKFQGVYWAITLSFKDGEFVSGSVYPVMFLLQRVIMMRTKLIVLRFHYLWSANQNNSAAKKQTNAISIIIGFILHASVKTP